MSIVKKKLATEELESIKKIRTEYTELTLALGELELQKLNIEDQKTQVLSVRTSLIEREISLAKQLQDKYGQGAINIETGEIE
jgi:hypothetical protein